MSKKRMVLRQVLAVALAVVCLLSMGGVQAFAMELTPPSKEKYEATTDGYSNTFKIKDDDGWHVAYCFNWLRIFPTSRNPYFAKIENANAMDMNKYSKLGQTQPVNGHSDPSDDPRLRDRMLTAVYNGYPTNGGYPDDDENGVFKKSGLYGIPDTLTNSTSAEYLFRIATQFAVWHFSDDVEYDHLEEATDKLGNGVESGSLFLGRLKQYFPDTYNAFVKAYQMLISDKLSYPEDLELDLFVHDNTDENPPLQNLLSTKIKLAPTEMKPVSVTLKAKKTINQTETPSDQQFSFSLMQGTATLQQKKNDAQGIVTFDALSFTQVGKFTYTVREDNSDDTSYIVDNTVYTVTIDVADTNNDGTLEAALTYTVDGAEVPAVSADPNYYPVSFNNARAGSGDITLYARKTLKNGTLEANQFEFQLLDGQDHVLETVGNLADGQVKFRTLYFDETGTYSYKIKEVKGSRENIIYDETVYNVTVTVAADGDDEDTKLDVTCSITNPQGEAVGQNDVTFENTQFKPAEVSLTASKAFAGGTLTGGDFTFVLKNENGYVVDTKKNDQQGAVTFD